MTKYSKALYGDSEYGKGLDYGENNGASLICSFSVSSINTIVKPIPDFVWNQFDELGLIVGLRRNIEEKNRDFKRRILDTFVHRANSSYQGLVNGISRDLGLEFYYPVVINPKRNSGGFFLADDPRVVIDGIYLYLYSDYQNGLVEHKIDCFQTGGNVELFGSLVDWINANSSLFEAELTNEEYRNKRSATLLSQESILTITQSLPISTRIKLQYPQLVKGSIIFDDGTVFRQRVENENDLLLSGQYYVDYINSILIPYSLPIEEINITYSYHQLPFKPIASSVLIHNINSTNFIKHIFTPILEQLTQQEMNGMITELGVDIINEILSITPNYWGK